MTSPAIPSALPARVHHLQPAALTALAVLLAVGLPEVLGDEGRLAAVLVLQLGLVLTWVVVTGIQGFAGSLTVGAAAAVAADLVLVLPGRPVLGDLLVVLGLGFLAAVVQQMVRTPRTDLVASLSGSVLLLAAVGSLAALLLLGRTPEGHDRALVALLAVGVALLVGHLVDLVLPRPRLAPGVPRGLVGLVLSVGAGALVAYLGRDVGGSAGALPALVLGAVLAGVTALVALAASYVVVEASAADGDGAGPLPAGVDPSVSPWALSVVQAVLPFAACAPVALAVQAVL
ncbi:hypothetical protein [Blastococcus tunisiensis]|uniref:Uncharacterized protein n=1 Tax=Blastococcus tunisiensis TaxID=1798228 RepID=A0A1I2JXQ3_9ACTN|nr:hypothetical protein [Blastococcus sp. DSM 46838]SFF59314.1 hypothetical protein SAMN05216574_11863 [Blastococcus sp. DSM 46838]